MSNASNSVIHEWERDHSFRYGQQDGEGFFEAINEMDNIMGADKAGNCCSVNTCVKLVLCYIFN